MINSLKKYYKEIFSSILILSISLLFFFWFNNGRVGLTLDSISYISAADNTKKGLGLFVQSQSGGLQNLYHFPPILSLILSLFSKSSWEALYVINILSFGVSCIIIFYLLRIAIKSNLLSALFTLLWSLNIYTLKVFSMSWSEPLFIAVVLICLLIWFYISQKKSTRLVYIVILVTSFLPLLRYAGLFILPLTLMLMLIIPSYQNIKEKIVHLFIQVILLFSPYVFWNMYISQNGQSARKMIFNTLTLEKIGELFNTFGSYVGEFSHNQTLIIGILIILVLAIFPLMMTRTNTLSQRAIWIYLISLAITSTYILFLFISMTFFDSATPFDFRILSVVTPMIILMFAIITTTIQNPLKILLPILLISIMFLTYWGEIKQIKETCLPLANPKYDNMKIIDIVKENPDVFIVTDGWETIYSRVPCNCARLGRVGVDNTDYFDSLKKEVAKSQNSYLSYTGYPNSDKKFIAKTEYDKYFNTEMIYSNGDEKIYLIKLK